MHDLSISTLWYNELYFIYTQSKRPPPHGPVEAVGTEAMSTLGLKRSSEDVVTAVAQVLVLQLVAQDLLGEAGFVALHGRGGGRLLRGHGACSRVTPGEGSEA